MIHKHLELPHHVWRTSSKIKYLNYSDDLLTNLVRHVKLFCYISSGSQHGSRMRHLIADRRYGPGWPLIASRFSNLSKGWNEDKMTPGQDRNFCVDNTQTSLSNSKIHCMQSLIFLSDAHVWSKLKNKEWCALEVGRLHLAVETAKLLVWSQLGQLAVGESQNSVYYWRVWGKPVCPPRANASGSRAVDWSHNRWIAERPQTYSSLVHSFMHVEVNWNLSKLR